GRGICAGVLMHADEVLGHLILLGLAPAPSGCSPSVRTGPTRIDRCRKETQRGRGCRTSTHSGTSSSVVRSSAVTAKPKPRRNRTLAQLYTAAAAGVPSA